MPLTEAQKATNPYVKGWQNVSYNLIGGVEGEIRSCAHECGVTITMWRKEGWFFKHIYFEYEGQWKNAERFLNGLQTWAKRY